MPSSERTEFQRGTKVDGCQPAAGPEAERIVPSTLEPYTQEEKLGGGESPTQIVYLFFNTAEPILYILYTLYVLQVLTHGRFSVVLHCQEPETQLIGPSFILMDKSHEFYVNVIGKIQVEKVQYPYNVSYIKIVYQSVRAAITKCHRWNGENNRNLF